PTTHRDHEGASLETRLQEPIVEHREPGEVLVLLAVGELDRRRVEARRPQRLDDRFTIERTDSLAGDDRRAPVKAERGEASANAGEETRADDDRVRARAESDLDLLHRSLRGHPRLRLDDLHTVTVPPRARPRARR